MRFLLGKGVEVNGRDERGRTVLYSAARWGSKEMVKILLECGAEVNATAIGADENQVKPLHS